MKKSLAPSPFVAQSAVICSVACLTCNQIQQHNRSKVQLDDNHTDFCTLIKSNEPFDGSTFEISVTLIDDISTNNHPQHRPFPVESYALNNSIPLKK